MEKVIKAKWGLCIFGLFPKSLKKTFLIKLSYLTWMMSSVSNGGVLLNIKVKSRCNFLVLKFADFSKQMTLECGIKKKFFSW